MSFLSKICPDTSYINAIEILKTEIIVLVVVAVQCNFFPYRMSNNGTDELLNSLGTARLNAKFRKQNAMAVPS